MKKVLKKFGKYLLLDLLAQGGMAEIYRAWAPSVDGGGRLVVLKCVQPTYGEDPEFIRMFRSEIRVTMGLNHPNIVQLYDFGEIELRPYIAMEFVEGKNLKQFIARVQQVRKKMDPEIAAYIISQVAAGLHFAHSYRDRSTGEPLNIIHRDISPQNLLLSYQGNIKIIDFGIAKAAGNGQNTRTGIIKGKPSYLSPEQIEGRELDARSDVFSLGAVLWETLTGRKLFAGDSDLAAIRLIDDCDKTVKPPSTLNPAVPPELDAIVLKSLAKDRDRRFKSAEEMQRVLHRFVYAFKKDFDPADFSRYLRQLFKTDIDEEQRSIQQLNAEARELFQQIETERKTEKPSTFTHMELQAVPLAVNPEIRKKVTEFKKSPASKAVRKKTGGKLLIPVLLVGAAVYFAPQWLPKTPQPRPAQPTTAPAQLLIPVKLQIHPSGGDIQVLLNDRPEDPSAIRLQSGTSAKLNIVKPGFKPFEKQIIAAPGTADLSVEADLEPSVYGILSLKTVPTAEARIVSDTLTWTHPTPIQGLKLPPGRYQVQLVNQFLGMKKDLSFEIRPGKTFSQDVNLDVVK